MVVVDGGGEDGCCKGVGRLVGGEGWMADYDWGGGGFGGVFRGEVRLEWDWLGEWMLGQWHRNVPGWGGGWGGRLLILVGEAIRRRGCMGGIGGGG